MITQQEVLNSLAQAEVVRFKETETNLLYAATMVEGRILVWPLPIAPHEAELITVDEFVDRFEESSVTAEQYVLF